MKSAEPVAASREAGLESARQALQTGRLETAAQCCRALLDKGESADALALMGEVDYRRGKPDSAAQWLERALAADRRHARAHWVLGNISQDDGKLDRAISSYRRALRADPKLVEAHNDLGTAYFAKAWHKEAEECYRRALELNANDVGATENLAAALRAQGRLSEARDAFVRTLTLRVTNALARLLGFRRAVPKATTSPANSREALLETARQQVAASRWDEAEPVLRKLLADAPDDADGHFLLGGMLAMTKRRADAIRHLEQAVALRSSAPEFYVALGNALADDQQFVKATEAYQSALVLDPAHPAATANIARVLHEVGHFREAEEVYRLSLQHDPDLAGAHSSLAGTLLSLGKSIEAEAAARKALEINPRLLHALLMLANALLDQGRFDEAEATIRKGEDIDPNDPELLRWTGVFHMMIRGDFERAESYLRRAKALAPDNASVHINLARTLLIRGRFEEGWEEYEWRRRESLRMGTYARLPYPDWDGSPLAGKAIVVNCEQGLGDEVMFASCLAELAAQARRCVLFCNRRLETLFRRSFAFAEVVGGSHQEANDPFPPLEGIDFQVAAGSLPRFFRRSAAQFPRHDGYLKADPGRIARWRERLGALGPGLKIGLSWKGGTPLSGFTRRTLRLEQFAPLFALPGTHWVSLQYGDTAAERQELKRFTLHHWQEAVDDLDDTCALMSALDLRISVCNTQVHLSGGLGKEVWVLTPLSPDSRYGCAGDRMLWYPAARMFRQPKAGTWAEPLARVEEALKARLGSP